MGDIYFIHNRIDDSDQELHEDEIMDENLTNIGKAMKLGNFILI